MKKKTTLLIAGCILTLTAACQNRNPRAPAATLSAQEQPSVPVIKKEEEDVDLHVYGTNDTSTSWDTELHVEPSYVIADIAEVLEKTLPTEEQEVVKLEVEPLDAAVQ